MQNGLIVLSYFNLSEIGGNAFAGMLSNAYYPAAERSTANTLARAGSQVMWDTVFVRVQGVLAGHSSDVAANRSQAVRAGKSGR